MGESPQNDLAVCECWHANSGPYIDWQFDQFRPFLGNRIADVGCALGHFTARLTDRELYLGLEPDETLAKKNAEAFRDCPNVKIVSGVASDITRPEALELIRANRADTVLSVNVLEHIKDDALALKNMTESLDKGRFLCLLVPAMPSAFGPMDQTVGHFRRYSKKSLRSLIAGLPLKVLRLYSLNLIGGVGWWVKNRFFKVRAYQPGDFKTINTILPLIRFCEDRIKPPFGLSLILIAQRI